MSCPCVKVAVLTSVAFVRGMPNIYVNQHEATGGSWTTRFFDTGDEGRPWLESFWESDDLEREE